MCNAAPLDQGGIALLFCERNCRCDVGVAANTLAWGLGFASSGSTCDLPKAKSASKAATIRRLFFRGRIVF